MNSAPVLYFKGRQLTGKQPSWWGWELDLSLHVLEQIEERGITEIELRDMLQSPYAWTLTLRKGAWLVHCRLYGRRWRVVVEPEYHLKAITVITAYPVE